MHLSLMSKLKTLAGSDSFLLAHDRSGSKRRQDLIVHGIQLGAVNARRRRQSCYWAEIKVV